MADKKSFKFKTNIPAKVEFLYDQPKKGTHDEYGDWFLYGVKKDGEDNAFFATPFLNDTLAMAGVKKGTIALITQNERDSGPEKYWTVQIGNTIFSSDDLDGSTPKANSISTSAPVSVPEEKFTLDDLADTMATCYEKIHMRLGQLQEDTIQKMAVSLFITVEKHGLYVKSEAPPVENSPTEELGQPDLPDNVPPGEEDLPF